MKIRLGIGVECLHFGGFDSDYQAILDRAVALNYTLPSASEQTIQNQLIIDLKAQGIWAKLDGFFMFANNVFNGVTYAGRDFACLNWKVPSNLPASPVSQYPSISAKAGFSGNGSNQALDLKIQHASGTNFTNPNGSAFALVGTIPGVSSAVLSTTSTTGGANPSRIRNSQSGATSSIVGSTIVSPYTSNSFVHINRKTGPTIQAFVNGVSAGTSPTPAAWSTTDTTNWHILYNGTSWGTTPIKVAGIGGDLSAEQATLNTIISNYITSLNAL
jgi:hypothetical protein